MNIHNTALIRDSAKISPGVTINRGVVVDEGATICENCIIGHNSYIGKQATIYRDVKIGSGVMIHDHVTVKDDVGDGAIVKGNVEYKTPGHTLVHGGQLKIIYEGKEYTYLGLMPDGNVRFDRDLPLGLWGFLWSMFNASS